MNHSLEFPLRWKRPWNCKINRHSPWGRKVLKRSHCSAARRIHRPSKTLHEPCDGCLIRILEAKLCENAQFFFRRFLLPILDQRAGEIQANVGVVRGKRNRPLLQFDRALDLTRVEQQLAQRVENPRVVRRKLVRLFGILESLRILQLARNPSQVVERDGVVRVCLQQSLV